MTMLLLSGVFGLRAYTHTLQGGCYDAVKLSDCLGFFLALQRRSLTSGLAVLVLGSLYLYSEFFGFPLFEVGYAQLGSVVVVQCSSFLFC